MGPLAMKTIRVSDVTHRAILDCAILPVCPTATRQPDGCWLVPLEDDTWEALQQQRLPGESRACPRADLWSDPWDDAIQRLIHRHRGRPLN